jgi:S1-C subfamily serine protease
MRILAAALLLAATMTARGRDVVIQPLIDPPAVVAEAMMAPAMDRSEAVEVARLRLDDDVVQLLGAPVSLPAESEVPFAASVRIELEGAEASRLRFSGVPEGTVLWLAGSEDAQFIRFSPTSADSWGPTTHGATVFVAAQATGSAGTIVAAAAVESISTNSSSCLEDVACPAASAAFDDVMDASRAIAYVRFVRDGKAQVCTGALVSDASRSRTPFLLTARHCIDSAATAATVEVIWDLRTSSCGSTRMAQYSRGYGAELVAASEKTDVALLKLNSVPAGRVFLGIDTRVLDPGTPVHRVSHANGLSQTFAAGVVDSSGWTCPRAPRSSFIYSRPTLGGITTGSSGAPLLVGGLYVAGQLLGLCGADPSNPCASFNDTVDGSIRESWPVLAPHLDPASLKPKRRAAR